MLRHRTAVAAALILAILAFGATSFLSPQLAAAQQPGNTVEYNGGPISQYLLPNAVTVELFAGSMTPTNSDSRTAWMLNLGLQSNSPVGGGNVAQLLFGGRFGFGSADFPNVDTLTLQLFFDIGVELFLTPPPAPMFSLAIVGSIGWAGLFLADQASNDNSIRTSYIVLGIELEPRFYLARLVFLYIGFHAHLWGGLEGEITTNGVSTSATSVNDITRAGIKFGAGFRF